MATSSNMSVSKSNSVSALERLVQAQKAASASYPVPQTRKSRVLATASQAKRDSIHAAVVSNGILDKNPVYLNEEYSPGGGRRSRVKRKSETETGRGTQSDEFVNSSISPSQLSLSKNSLRDLRDFNLNVHRGNI